MKKLGNNFVQLQLFSLCGFVFCSKGPRVEQPVKTPFSLESKIQTLVRLLPAEFSSSFLNETEIRRKILTNYDKLMTPAQNTTVSLSNFILRNFHLDYHHHTLDVDAVLLLNWTDTRLKFSLLKTRVLKVAVSPTDIWIPDIVLQNSIRTPFTVSLEKPSPMVYKPGYVIICPTVNLRVYCFADLTHWPHDIHKCSLIFGPSFHRTFTIDIAPQEDHKIPSGKSQGGWKLEEHQLYLQETEAVDLVHLNLTLSRNAPSFAWTIKLPTAGLSFLTLLVFLLPPSAGGKITLCGICFILHTMFLMYSSTVVGNALTHTPLIVKVICWQWTLALVSVIVSGITFRLPSDSHKTGIPRFCRRWAPKMASFFCLKKYYNLAELAQPSKSDGMDLGKEEAAPPSTLPSQESTIRKEWLFVTAVVDRICLLLFVPVLFVNVIRICFAF